LKGLGADDRYWEALAEGHMELPRCAKCRRWRWPAPFRCGDCGSWEMDWNPVELRGRIFSWTRTWHRFGGTESLDLPYVSVLVELAEAGGVRLLGVLEGDTTNPAIGVPVSGRVDRTVAFDRAIPALRWSIAA
jgi:uncharacterized protein